MNVPLDREFLTQGVIALTVCLGGWMFLVKPKAEELRELELQIAQQRARIAVTDQAAIEHVAAYAPAVRRRAEDIEAHGVLARDSSALYGRIRSLAEKEGVEVNNLRPSQEQHSAGTDKPFATTRWDMTVDGDYERIALFLEGLDRIGAYLRPVSVQLAPVKGDTPTYTTMQLGFEVLRFILPESLTERGEAAP